MGRFILKKRKKITFDQYIELFRKQKKYVMFGEFLDWCETIKGKKWMTKNSNQF